MPNRRCLSLWFPRLAAERVLRRDPGLAMAPLATVAEAANMQVLTALSATASAAGLMRGQSLRDARAMCPDLLTRAANPQAEAVFLGGLRRWAGKFSPWVAEEAPDALVVDLTGCAHLFGGEAALMAQIETDCADLGLTVRAGIADTVGAAWALARYAGHSPVAGRSGDAIDQEARATRSRAAKRRHWERGGPAPDARPPAQPEGRISAPGQTRQALAALPVAALRLDAAQVTGLTRLGLRRIGDLAGQPRAGLARRFGRDLVRRLDQALGVEPEPVSPARPALHFAVRLTLPEPIGLEADILAGIDRLLPRLETLLTTRGHGARRVCLQVFRSDQSMQTVEVGLARAASSPDRIRPLLAMKLGEIDAGFGIDMLRMVAAQTEPVHDRQFKGHLEVGREVDERFGRNTVLDDLIGKLGARIGLEAITCRHPASSHIPEKAFQTLAAAWADTAPGEWPAAPVPRPMVFWRPESVQAPEEPRPPLAFRWRGRSLETAGVRGPERIAPEWWLDEPAWRSGPRDYWVVTTRCGERLWLYYAHGATMSAGWFCQGQFA